MLTLWVIERLAGRLRTSRIFNEFRGRTEYLRTTAHSPPLSNAHGRLTLTVAYPSQRLLGGRFNVRRLTRVLYNALESALRL